MKHKTVERTLKVSVIEFADGTEVDLDVVLRFLDEAYDFEHTIGKKGNWTSEYIYFEGNKEKALESVLEKMNVIVKPDNFKDWNDKVSNGTYYNHYKYWLGEGYYELEKFINSNT